MTWSLTETAFASRHLGLGGEPPAVECLGRWDQRSGLASEEPTDARRSGPQKDPPSFGPFQQMSRKLAPASCHES